MRTKSTQVPLAAHTESDPHTHELPAQPPQKVRLMVIVWLRKCDAGQLVPRAKYAKGFPHAAGLGFPAVMSLTHPTRDTHDTVRAVVKEGGWKGRAGGVRWDERAVEVPHADPPRGPLERVDASARGVERRTVRVGQRINAASLHRP